MNSFLVGFGLSYPIRCVNFLRTKIDKLYSLDEEAHKMVSGHFKGFWDEKSSLTDDQKKQFRVALLRIKPQLNDIYIMLRREGRLIRSRPSPDETQQNAAPANPVRDKILALIQAVNAAALRATGARNSPNALLDYFLADKNSPKSDDATARQRLSESQIEEECTARAKHLLEENAEIRRLINDAGSVIEARITDARKDAEHRALALLTAPNTSVNEDVATSAARACLLYYYERYDDYDMVTFPMFYETEVGESDVVEVIRVSPEDAKALIDEVKTGCRKLAGTALGHFGAFLDQLWRKNDILWGRLDGAERIITALLPNHPQKRRLIGEAQAAILCEIIDVMGQTELYDLLVESFMRTRTRHADEEALTTLKTYLENLKNYCSPELKARLAARINDGELRDYYLMVFKERSQLKPE